MMGLSGAGQQALKYHNKPTSALVLGSCRTFWEQSSSWILLRSVCYPNISGAVLDEGFHPCQDLAHFGASSGDLHLTLQHVQASTYTRTSGGKHTWRCETKWPLECRNELQRSILKVAVGRHREAVTHLSGASDQRRAFTDCFKRP